MDALLLLLFSLRCGLYLPRSFVFRYVLFICLFVVCCVSPSFVSACMFYLFFSCSSSCYDDDDDYDYHHYYYLLFFCLLMWIICVDFYFTK